MSVSMLSTRDVRESFGGGNHRRGSSMNSRATNAQQHMMVRSNSLVQSQQPSNVSTFLTVNNDLTHYGLLEEGEDREVFVKRRLQMARVKAQMAWVLAADPKRCLEEGEVIKVCYMCNRFNRRLFFFFYSVFQTFQTNIYNVPITYIYLHVYRLTFWKLLLHKKRMESSWRLLTL
jgi:hypothetical protein